MMFDALICGGTVVDGSGAAGFRADVAVTDGRIAAIGALNGASARETVDAHGKTVTPGFIDIHRHADFALFRPGFGELELRQGLTTIVNGNCGLSAAPCAAPHAEQILSYLTPVTGGAPQGVDCSSMERYLACARQSKPPIHVGMLAGSGTIRACAAGFDTLRLDDAQKKTLQTYLEQSLSAGALGVSLGLGYAPDCFYTTQELIDVLAPLSGSGIPVTVHMRQEGSGVVEALQEMIEVCRALRTPVEISHLKSIGTVNWRRCTPQMLELLRAAREDGCEIACDVYPYTAGSTQLIHVLPPESQQGGLPDLTRKLADPAFRAQLRQRMLTGSDFENISLLVGWENIVASSIGSPELQALEGKSIAQIAELWHEDPFDCLFDLLQRTGCAVTMIDFIADETDIARILQDDHSCVISDSTYPTTGMLHPRVYGTYTTLLEHFVRERKTLTLEQAVQRITAKPAAVMGLGSKGLLRVGMDADICVFDPERVHTCATYRDPARCSVGIDDVFVLGRHAVRDGRRTDVCAGTVLTR